MMPTSTHQQIEQALKNALLIQGSLHAGRGASLDRMHGELAEDDEFLHDLLENPGILELLRDLIEDEDRAGTPIATPGGFERRLRTRLQREIRLLSEESKGA